MRFFGILGLLFAQQKKRLIAPIFSIHRFAPVLWEAQNSGALSIFKQIPLFALQQGKLILMEMNQSLSLHANELMGE